MTDLTNPLAKPVHKFEQADHDVDHCRLCGRTWEGGNHTDHHVCQANQASTGDWYCRICSKPMDNPSLSQMNPKDVQGLKKPPLRLVPPALEIYAAYAFAHGALTKKYGQMNWRNVKVLHSIYLEAAKRHINCALDGEQYDPEITDRKIPHEAMAVACLGIILDSMALGTLINDLPTKGPAAELIRKLTKGD